MGSAMVAEQAVAMGSAEVTVAGAVAMGSEQAVAMGSAMVAEQAVAMGSAEVTVAGAVAMGSAEVFVAGAAAVETVAFAAMALVAALHFAVSCPLHMRGEKKPRQEQKCAYLLKSGLSLYGIQKKLRVYT
jgi:hypothetical protein